MLNAENQDVVEKHGVQFKFCYKKILRNFIMRFEVQRGWFKDILYNEQFVR